jgi:hypothetical protein
MKVTVLKGIFFSGKNKDAIYILKFINNNSITSDQACPKDLPCQLN